VINNSLLALDHYPHKRHDLLPDYLSFEADELDPLLTRYRTLRGFTDLNRPGFSGDSVS